MECMCCMNDIETIVKYRVDNEWFDCGYCEDCIKYMLKTQFQQYVEDVKKEKCKVALKRLVTLGPPMKFRDPNINNGKEVDEFNLFPADLENIYPSDELEEYKSNLVELLSTLD